VAGVAGNAASERPHALPQPTPSTRATETTLGTQAGVGSVSHGASRGNETSAGQAVPRRAPPVPLPTRNLPGAPAASAGPGFSISILFAVLAGFMPLALARAGRRLLPSSALAPPMIFASPLERPG
jgi:hypothetical protein